jgi:molybdopterin/thiamine biosynthesis adenylyltransferase
MKRPSKREPGSQILVPEAFEHEIFSRNSGLLSSATQQKARHCRLLLIGCGLGSEIALLAARTGFQRFTLCDGDAVEIHNLNRQSFGVGDVGKNKAEATRQKILEINPLSRISTHPRFVRSRDEVATVVRGSDLVVNMADPDDAVYLINDEAKSNGKPVFFPLTFGLGGYVLVFSPESASLQEILGGKILGVEFFEKLVMETVQHLPLLAGNKHLGTLMETYREAIREGRGVPQLGISAHITAALVVKAMIRWIEGSPMPLAPTPLVVEPWK